MGSILRGTRAEKFGKQGPSGLLLFYLFKNIYGVVAVHPLSLKVFIGEIKRLHQMMLHKIFLLVET